MITITITITITIITRIAVATAGLSLAATHTARSRHQGPRPGSSDRDLCTRSAGARRGRRVGALSAVPAERRRAEQHHGQAPQGRSQIRRRARGDSDDHHATPGEQAGEGAGPAADVQH
jgi:hypothetical protein